ncbi:preprotein translocase subunit SecA, partial [Amycolatopsis vancoresmycina DSM 44592]
VPTGNGQATEGRHARPAPPQPPTTDTESVPAALRGKGLGGGGQPSGMTLSGPGEDGEVESHAEGGARPAGGGAGGTRRDRRAAQRDAAKKGKKGPRR